MSEKAGALQLSPTQYKQLVNVCRAVVRSQQQGGGYAPRRGSIADWYRAEYDVPIWVKPSKQTGGGWWDSMKGIFDRARKSELGKKVIGKAVDAGVGAVSKRVGKEARKRGYGDQYDMYSGMAEGKARGKAKQLMGGGHQCGAGMYPAGY